MSSFLYELNAKTSVATITLNRPERLNALTFETYTDLRDTFVRLDTEPSVRAIIITGAGRAFCSGGDVEEIIGALLGRELQALHDFTRLTCDLILAMRPMPPLPIREIAGGLQYRDFMTVGLLCEKLQLQDVTASGKAAIRDNWIYIQEPDVLVGRLQIFNNWSPFMVADPAKTWIGLEYFCTKGDELWELQESLRKVEESVTWQALQRARSVLYGAIGEDTRLARESFFRLELGGKAVELFVGNQTATADEVEEFVGRSHRRLI